MSTILRARGGWWHDYVCPTHGVELDPPVGGTYPCRHGCCLEGEAYAGAWVVMEHQARARQARLLARRHAERGAGADRDRAVEILRDFASYYDEVADAGTSTRAEPWMLAGKLFSQALTEAIWAVQVADAVTVVASTPQGRAALGEPVARMLRRVLETVSAAWVQLVEVRCEPANNYVAWLDAAGALVCRALGALGGADAGGPDDVVLDPALWRQRALAYLDVAIAEDGWEWEGSTYYHLFVLRAVLLGLQGVDPGDVPDDALERLAAMVTVLVRLAGPDGALPALHDGPYDRVGVHLEVLEVCSLSRLLWHEPPVGDVEGWVRRRLGAGHDGLEDALDGWFAGPPHRWPGAGGLRGSAHFPATGYVVLRDPADTVTAIVDAGPHGGSHGHLDKLSLYLYGDGVAWQPAPGVPPYGSPLRHGHYARTAAHPTVRVDGQDQVPATGSVELLELGETSRLVAGSGGAIEGVHLVREVVVTPDHVLDVVRVRVEAPDREVTLALRPAVPWTVTAGDGGWRTTWRGPAGKDLHGVHRATVPSALVAGPGRGPSNDPSLPLTVGDWSARGHDVAFVSVYTPGQARVAALELVRAPAGQDDAALVGVRVRTTAGTTHDHEVTR